MSDLKPAKLHKRIENIISWLEEVVAKVEEQIDDLEEILTQFEDQERCDLDSEPLEIVYYLDVLPEGVVHKHCQGIMCSFCSRYVCIDSIEPDRRKGDVRYTQRCFHCAEKARSPK